MALNERELLLVYERLNEIFREDIRISRPLVQMLRQAGKDREASEIAFLTAQRMISSQRSESALGFLEMCRQIGHPSEDEINSLMVIAELTGEDSETRGNSSVFPLVSQLSDQESMDFIAHGDLRRFNVGETVLEQDEVSDSFYLILDGRVHIHMHSGNSELSLNQLGPGDFFGEFASIYHLPRSATATTLTPCLLLELSEEDIQKLMQASPLAGEYLLNIVRQRMVYSMSCGHPALADIAEIDREWMAKKSSIYEFSSQQQLQADSLPEGQWAIVFIGAFERKKETGETKRFEAGEMFSTTLPAEETWQACGRTFVYCLSADVFASFCNAYVPFEEWVQSHVEGAPAPIGISG